jgi:hypothetical protein
MLQQVRSDLAPRPARIPGRARVPRKRFRIGCQQARDLAQKLRISFAGLAHEGLASIRLKFQRITYNFLDALPSGGIVDHGRLIPLAEAVTSGTAAPFAGPA